MTLHWWMHWFWITVIGPALVSVFVSAPLCHCAPHSSLVSLPAELLSAGTPESPAFQHDSSLYVAILQDAASPTIYTDDDTDDTPVPSVIFPLLQNPTEPIVQPEHHLPSGAAAEETTPEEPEINQNPESQDPNHKTLESHDNPMDEEALTSESDGADEQTKMFARDISLAARNGKAIGRDFVSPTPIPQDVVTPQVSNHNPFISSVEEINKNDSDLAKKLEVPATIPPSSALVDEKEDKVHSVQQDQDEIKVSATSPKEQEMVAMSTTAAPDVPEKTVVDLSTEKHGDETSVVPVLPSLPPPAWVNSMSGEDESAEEAEAEESARPNASIAEEQPTELDGNDVSSEAVTKGRMPEDQGLDAISIVGIVLGLIGFVFLVGGTSGLVWYRRRYLNKPQTLNDKCSNADSSGYIDDTLRDNSEEMYSLDNDSFLNSLEAMTIQNYWTDSVKHTKL